MEALEDLVVLGISLVEIMTKREAGVIQSNCIKNILLNFLQNLNF